MIKFTEFIKESFGGMTEADIDELKTLTKYMKTDREKKKYIDSLDALFAGYNAKSIYNADFSEYYSYGLVRPLETAWNVVRDSIRERLRENNFAEDSSSTGFSVNSIRKEIRHWEVLKEKYPEMYNFWFTVRKLPDFIKELKTYTIKGRKPKAVDPNVYQKPMVPLEAKKKAIEFLSASVEAIRQEYYRKMIGRLKASRDEAMNYAKSVDFDSRKFYQIKMNPEVKMISNRIFKTTFSEGKNRLVLSKDHDAIVENLARMQVDDIIKNFLVKNSEKLGHIFAKKAKITEHKILKNEVVGGNLENAMFFKFSDDSYFTIYTSTVYGYSPRGKLFVKFPTRFTNVFHNGKKMSMPSEQKMIEEF